MLKTIKEFVEAIYVIGGAIITLLCIPIWLDPKLNFFQLRFFLLHELPTVILIICSAIFIISLFILFFRKGKSQSNSNKKDRRYLALKATIVFVLYFLSLAYYIYSKSKLISDSGVLGTEFYSEITATSQEFNSLLFKKLSGHYKNDTVNFSRIQIDKKFIDNNSDINYLFAFYYNKGLFFKGTVEKNNESHNVFVDCSLNWCGEIDPKITHNSKLINEASIDLYNFKLKLETSIEVVANFILGYNYLHESDNIGKAKNYFNLVKNDSTFIKALNSSMPSEDLLKFNSNLDSLIYFANRLDLTDIEPGHKKFPFKVRASKNLMSKFILQGISTIKVKIYKAPLDSNLDDAGSSIPNDPGSENLPPEVPKKKDDNVARNLTPKKEIGIPNGKYGYVDDNNKLIIPYKFDSAGAFHEDLAVIAMLIDNRVPNKFRYNYINTSGIVVTRGLYDKARNFNYGMAIVKSGGNYGVIDKNENIVALFKYDFIYDFEYTSMVEPKQLVAKVMIKNFCGYINNKGEEIIEPKYFTISGFTNGTVNVVIDGKLKTLDIRGNEVK